MRQARSATRPEEREGTTAAAEVRLWLLGLGLHRDEATGPALAQRDAVGDADLQGPSLSEAGAGGQGGRPVSGQGGWSGAPRARAGGQSGAGSGGDQGWDGVSGAGQKGGQGAGQGRGQCRRAQVPARSDSPLAVRGQHAHQLPHAVVQRRPAAVQTHHQVVLAARVQHHQLVPAAGHAQPGHLRGAPGAGVRGAAVPPPRPQQAPGACRPPRPGPLPPSPAPPTNGLAEALLRRTSSGWSVRRPCL